MRILGRDLKKIIKEEIITQADIEAKKQKLAAIIAGGRIRSGTAYWNKLHPNLDLGPMRDFFASVLAGEKTVSPRYNSPEENLYINKALSVFEKRAMMTRGNKIELQSFPPSTYPESGIRKLQVICMLTRDGIFGRQALAAAISPFGATRLDPTVSATDLDKFVEDASSLVADGDVPAYEFEDEIIGRSAEQQAADKAADDAAEEKKYDTFNKTKLGQALAQQRADGTAGTEVITPPETEVIDKTLPLREGKNITERLMERWLK